MITVEEVEKMRAEAQRLELSGRELLNDTELVRSECNGTGAKWMGMLCGIIDIVNPAFTLPSWIHDLRYYNGGSDAQRKTADDEWLDNALICVNDRYGWYNPYRYIERSKARRFYLALRTAGELAWNNALAEAL